MDGTIFAVRAAESSAVVRKVAWRLMPLISVCYFFAFFDRINISFAKAALTADLGLSNAAYGLGVSLFTIGYVLCEVPSNMILYRVGTRQWIARIMISWGIATAAMIFITNEYQFYALRFLIGALEAGFTPGIIYYMTTWFPTSYRSRSMSYFFVASAVCGILGGPLAGVLLTYMDGVGGYAGWHWLFLFGGLPCIVLGVVVYKFLDNRIEDAKWLSDDEKRELLAGVDSTPQSGKTRSFTGALRAPGFLVLALAYFAITTSSAGLNFWIPDLIRTAGADSHLTVGLLTAIPYFFAAVAMLAVSRYADASGARRHYLLGCMFTAFLGLMVSAYFSQNVVILVIALAVTGCGLAGFGPTFWALPPRLLAGAGAAGGIALINMTGQLGGIVSPFMIGVVKDMTGTASPALYGLGFLCLSGLLILALFSSPQIKANDRDIAALEPQPVAR